MNGYTNDIDPETGEVLRPPPGAMTSVIQVLQALENGQLVKDASEALAELVHALHDRHLVGQKASGKFTIVLGMKMDRGLITVEADVKTKSPETVRGISPFYVANARFLSRQDPYQPDLPLRDVNTPASTGMRTV